MNCPNMAGLEQPLPPRGRRTLGHRGARGTTPSTPLHLLRNRPLPAIASLPVPNSHVFIARSLHRLVTPCNQCRRSGMGLLRAAGASAEEAQTVMEHLVGANVAGHDSHGLILLPTYIARIKRGHIVPGAPMTIEQETPTSARINGNWGFGYVVTTRAM